MRRSILTQENDSTIDINDSTKREKKMKAILIDVHNKDIKEIEHDGKLENIYDLINCRAFDLVTIDDVNAIFVDDEGILKDNLYFEYSGNERVMQFAGSGLVLGYNGEGKTISTTLSVEDVKGKVRFLGEGFTIDPHVRFTAWE